MRLGTKRLMILNGVLCLSNGILAARAVLIGNSFGWNLFAAVFAALVFWYSYKMYRKAKRLKQHVPRHRNNLFKE